MLYILNQIEEDLASKVAKGLGMEIPTEIDTPLNQAIGADADVEKHQPPQKKVYLDKSEALSQTHLSGDSIVSRKIAALVSDGFDGEAMMNMKNALEEKGAIIQLVATH
jgi:catalase